MKTTSFASFLLWCCVCLSLTVATTRAEGRHRHPGRVVSPPLPADHEFLDFEILADAGDEKDSPPTVRRVLQGSSEAEKVNIFQKLKESLGASILGLLLVCLMPCLIWKNEGRHVRELARIDFCKNEAVVVDAESPTDETVDRLVHFCGNVRVDEDFLLNLSENGTSDWLALARPVPGALMIKRTCYIYQKFEDSRTSVDKKVGGGEVRTTNYTVREDWTAMGPQKPQLEHNPGETNGRGIWDQLVQASGGSNEEQAAPSPNTPQLPPEIAEKLGLVDTSKAPHGEAVSKGARVGGFGLSSAVIRENPQAFAASLVPVPNELVPESVPGCEGLTKGTDHVLRTFPQGTTPQNGDCKVVYEYVLHGFECSFVVKQVPSSKGSDDVEAAFGVDRCLVVDDKCMGACHNELGDIWMVRKGHHDLQSMIHLARDDEAKTVKLLRLICWLGLMLGWVFLFQPFVTVLEVLPILARLGGFAVVLVAMIVSCLCCMSVSLLAYFRYRPALSLGLLTLVGGIWGLVIWRLNEAAQTPIEDE